MSNGSEHGLSLTSQFYFCALPLRLDTYSKCTFACTYCFALARGGNRQSVPHTYDAEALDRRLERVATGRVQSIVDEFLAHRQPIHLGGMTDPFPSIERTAGVTLAVLRVLRRYSYPTVISTKGDLFAEAPYIDVLAGGTFALQVSMSSTDGPILERIDRGAPSPARRLTALRLASDAGIPTSVRIQPVLPGLESDALEVLDAAVEAGCRHVGAEYLKLPIEHSWAGSRKLTEAIGERAIARYKCAGRRIGREWVLPINDRLPLMVELNQRARRGGISFGAGDNDLLWLSDGTCCCSGVDTIPGFENHFRCNYTEAVRQGSRTGRVTLDSIRSGWRPSGTVARFMNSRSRLPPEKGRGAGLWSYISANWNGRPNGNSPAMFLGIEDSGERDQDGNVVYGLDAVGRELHSNFAPSRAASAPAFKMGPSDSLETATKRSRQ